MQKEEPGQPVEFGEAVSPSFDPGLEEIEDALVGHGKGLRRQHDQSERDEESGDGGESSSHGRARGLDGRRGSFA